MTNAEIRNLLARLRDEIQGSQLDTETRDLIRELESDIHKLLETEKADVEAASILNRAREFEANLESSHPTVVRVLSEVIETLSRMGI